MADPLSYHAFRWQDGTMIDLGLLPLGNVSQARAINSLGDVVGLATTQVGIAFYFHPFRWHDGVLTDLAQGQAIDIYAEGINDNGVIVGTRSPGGPEHALRWIGGTMTDLNSLLPPGSGITLLSAHAINASGRIAGQAKFPSGNPNLRGYVLDGTTVIDLGAMPNADFSRGFGINSAGDAVGDVFFVSQQPRAFIHPDGGSLIDLNTRIPAELGIRLTNAFAINDAGQIACDGHYLANSLPFHAFLLTPLDPADINLDGQVNARDLALLLGSWGACGDCAADINDDGVVDAADLAQLLGAWTR
jgi:probable HAF family extracellular repeat protein